MWQLIVLILISWGILWLAGRRNLSVLGLTPTQDRLKYFLLLFFLSAAISASAFLLRMLVARETYALSSSTTFHSVLVECWHQVRTVLTEELICRGAILYVLIRKLGAIKAIFISSLVFAALHWFNAGVWGDIPQMTIIFIFTLAMGLLLAYAYAKTFSLLLPFAIHLGWNLVQNYIFPDTSTGNHVFVLAEPPAEITISYLSFFTMLLLPKVLVIAANYLVIRKHRQVPLP